MQISSPPVLLDPDPPEHKLNRSLSALANFCIGFTEVAALSSVCQTLGFGIVTGGAATLVWSFFVNFLMTIIIGLNMAELCAAYPSAGAVYCWAGQVTPEKWAPLAAYVTGWSNFIGNAAGDASFAVGCASFFSAMLRACGNEGLSVDNQVLLSLFILWTQTGMNFFRVDQVGWVTVFGKLLMIYICKLQLLWFMWARFSL
jgi:amino acid transporter